MKALVDFSKSLASLPFLGFNVFFGSFGKVGGHLRLRAVDS